MVSTWSSGQTLQSFDFDDRGNLVLRKCGFTFVDFLPICRDPGGFFSPPVYETFRCVIDRANDWLRRNWIWKITTCESVEFKAKGEKVDASKMTYLEYGEASTSYIRGLRLWLTQRHSDNYGIQQIGYLNLIPTQREGSGIFDTASYETLDEVIEKFNAMAQSNPLPGRVITIETQEMKIPNSNVLDPDRSYWVEQGSSNRHFLFVIRIFYEITDVSPEIIGVKDFVPDVIKNGGVFSLPEYEPFSNIVKKASVWCTQQVGIRFCNAQSLEIKMKTGREFDTQKMDYTEHGSKATFYLRILRVAFTKFPAHQSVHKNDTIYGPLTCKTFVPVQLTAGMFMPDFENLMETKARVSAWVTAAGAKVLSAETAALRISTGGEAKHGTEASFTYNQAERDEYWIFVIRLYLLGIYREPPMEILATIPEIESPSCCTVT